MTSIKSQDSNSDAIYLLGVVRQDVSQAQNILDAFQTDEGYDREGNQNQLDGEDLGSNPAPSKSDERAVDDLAKTAPSNTGTSDNYIPMSMAAGIIMAFLAMISFSNNINQLQNELATQWAKANMGETTDASGKTTIDVNKSIVGQWYHGAVQAGQSQADGLRAQAIASLVSAGIGLAALGAMGVAHLTCSSGVSKGELENAQAYKNALEEGPQAEVKARVNIEGEPQEELAAGQAPDAAQGGKGVAAEEANAQQAGDAQKDAVAKKAEDEKKAAEREEDKEDAAEMAKKQAEVERRANEMRKGVKISNYSRGSEVDTNAIAQLRARPEELEEAIQQADKNLERLQNQEAASARKLDTQTQRIVVLKDVGLAASNGVGGWFNGQATGLAAQQKAQSEVAQQNQQQLQSSEEKAAQSAKDNQASANAAAENMAQALQAATRVS
jgi:hypothetical protein